MFIKRGTDSSPELAAALSARRIVVMACDTIYGLVGVAPDTEADICRIKGRGENKPFLVLIHDPVELKRLDVHRSDFPILSLWPGPFTFIFPTTAGDTVAVRVPQDPRLRDLIAKVGSPLFSTSVNRAGDAPMDDPVAIDTEFGHAVAVVEDSGVLPGRTPSTIVDLTVHPHRILRQGAGTVPGGYLLSGPNPRDS